MIHIKALFILFLFSVVSLPTYSQTDSTDIDDDTDSAMQVVKLNKISPHKRGIYKTYEEYMDNSPSVEGEFTVKPLPISKNNPLIAEGDVDYDGKRPKKIWGVSDGEYVYIRVMVGRFLKNHYFRLQCDGPQPYIYLVEHTVVVPFGLGAITMVAVAAGTAALPPFVSISIVRDHTNYMKPVLLGTNARVKRYLEDYPDLLAAYEKEPKHNKATKAIYLTEYNKRKK